MMGIELPESSIAAERARAETRARERQRAADVAKLSYRDYVLMRVTELRREADALEALVAAFDVENGEPEDEQKAACAALERDQP